MSNQRGMPPEVAYKIEFQNPDGSWTAETPRTRKFFSTTGRIREILRNLKYQQETFEYYCKSGFPYRYSKTWYPKGRSRCSVDEYEAQLPLTADVIKVKSFWKAFTKYRITKISITTTEEVIDL